MEARLQATAEPRSDNRDDEQPSLSRVYTMVSLVVIPAWAGVIALAQATPTAVRSPTVLLGPMFAVVLVTAVVFFLMLFARHIAILTRRAQLAFFKTFDAKLQPAPWVERPAQTFNNLMQTPTVFYAMGALMIHTGLVDSVQLSLAWAYAASRWVHAVVLVGWNDVKWRFAAAFIGFISLGIILYRFAVQSYPLWQPF